LARPHRPDRITLPYPRDKPARLIYIRAMIRAAAPYYFWFYGYPMPLAEVGVRSI
jgi:hypothetical protein